MHITNLISYCFGKFAKTKFPKTIQNIINASYVKLLKLDMSEFKNARYYKSLNELFTRELIIARQIDTNKDSIISPVDGFITEGGELKDDIALQIKGQEYSVEELLTYYASDNFKKIKNGSFVNFYLSPKDYHRYHAPVDFKIKKLIHVPGKLYPVNLKYLKKEFELFIQNERVILECENNGKLFYMVFVGALNVGQMFFEFESRIETNTNTKEIKVYTYDNIEVTKGECLGYFKMGSTIVMIWQKNSVQIDDLLNQHVKFGQKIGKL